MKLKSYTNKDRYGNMTSFEFYEGASVDMGDVPPMMQGIPDHPGDPKGTDTVPAWLTPGEFVMNAEATRMFEPQIEQMNNAGRAVQAQQGGTIPQYEADGGPVYMNQGGSWLDSLLGMFANKVLPEMPDATQGAIPPSDTSRDERVAALIEAAKTDGPTRPDPTMSNKMYMDFLKDKEGFRNEAYLDSAGVPTIGYGFTEGVQMGDTMDEKTANERLLKEMAKTDQDYNKLVTADLNPNQQAAVKSLLYNIGGPQFENSKARAALNAGNFESFKKEAAEFRMADGKVIPGLENRRRDELELFFKPYKADRPSVEDSPSAMIPAEDILARQQEVRRLQKDGTYKATSDVGDPFPPEPPSTGPDAEMIAAQAATARDGIYNSGDNDMGGLGSDTPENAARARLLREQQRMQQGQVPPITEANVPLPDELVGPEMNNVDDRSALQKFGESGGLMGFLDRNIVQPYEEGQERKRILSDQDRMQQGQTGKPPTPDMTVGELFSAASNIDPYTGEPKVDAGQDNTYRGVGIPQNRADADALAEEVDSTALKDAQEKSDKANSELEKATKELEAKQANGTATIDDVNSHKSVAAKADVANSNLESTIKSNEAGAANRKTAADEETSTVSSYDPKNPSVPKTGEPPKSDSILKDQDRMQQGQISKTVTPKDIADDKKFPDDGSVPKNTTPEDAEDKGKTAPPEQINKAESFLSGILGDLFDKGELKRMAIMYVGGRMLGGSHNGSLNFAAKQYVKRVDSKASEHKKYVKELTKDGSYTPKSIALYNKTKNISDLEKKGATYAPTGGAPITKMVPQFNKEGQVTGYKKATLVPVKNSITGGTHYQSRSGAVMHPAQVSSLNDYREELDANTEAYKQRRSRILGDMEGYFSEIRDKPGNFKGEGNDKEYIVGVGPKEAALAYYDWAKRQGVDPDSTAGRKVMTQAYETMVAEAAGKDIKYTPNDFTRYLEDQQLRETTGAPELFIINEDAVMNKKATPKYVQADKMSLLYQNLDTVISGIPNSSTDRGDIIGIAIQKWNKLDSSEEGRTLRKKYNDSAEKSAGESGFYKYMMDTAQALHAELNKPKE